MTVPTVTITVGGVPVSGMTAHTPEEVAAMVEGLHMMYVQATKDDKRYQWVFFPPAVPGLDLPAGTSFHPTRLLYLRRKQEFAGNRSKWFNHRLNAAQEFIAEMQIYADRGYVLTEPVVVPLEKDDYAAVWQGETPHKALRAVDRALKPLQLSIK